MSKIKSDLKGKTIEEEIQTTRNRATTLSSPDIKLTLETAKITNYKSASDILEVKQSALNAINDKHKQAVQERDDARVTLETLDTSIVDEINSKTSDINILLTTGFPIASDKSSPEPLVQVTNLSAATGDQSGEIDINFDRVKNASGYEYQISADSPDNWTNAGASGKTSKYTFTGLTSGKKYWIRARTIRGEEKGHWSNPVSTTVPH